MSIIDNVAELRARLEEIEREKAAGISGPVLILNEIGDIGRLEPLMPTAAVPAIPVDEVYQPLVPVFWGSVTLDPRSFDEE